MIRPAAPCAYVVRARAAARGRRPADCSVRAHDQQRQAPDALAQEGERAAGQALARPRPPRQPSGSVRSGCAVARAGRAPGPAAAARASSPQAAGEVVERRDRSARSAASTSSSRIGRITGMRPSAMTAMRSFSLDGQRLAYTVHGSGPRLTILLHGLLFSQRMHETLARGARRARAPRRHARPARPRRVRPPAREVALLDAGLRRAGRRAARPPRRARGGRDGHVAGRQRGARGRRAGAGAPARDGDRDAGARPRADRLRARVHAADGRADAGEPAMRALARAARLVPRRRCRGRPTSCSTGSARTRSRAPRSCRACSSAAPRRRARSARACRRPRW